MKCSTAWKNEEESKVSREFLDEMLKWHSWIKPFPKERYPRFP